MLFQARRPIRALAPFFALLVLLTSLPAWAAEKARLRVDDYVIDAEIQPNAHKLKARAKVKFTALEDICVVSFELHNALRPTKVLDDAGKPLSAERITQDSSVRVARPKGLAKDTSTTLTFDYEGVLESADESPVQGLKLAYVGDDTTYLLYAGRWFPVANYGVNRFTPTTNVTVPAHFKVIGSGKESVESAAAAASKAKGATTAALPSSKTYTFVSDKPSFPGTIIAGQFSDTQYNEAGVDIHVYFKPVHQALAAEYATTAAKEYTYFTTLYNPFPAPTVRIVELPDDTVPLSSAGKLDMFSPEFQSLTTDKGAMILHMLRWVEGEAKFDQTMRTFATQYMEKSASLDDFRAIAEKDYGDKLTWFFSQWLDSTGAPEFKSKYTVYRLGENNKGFRVVGEIAQDLDLFRMPVELKIDTDGKTENKRVEVVGTNSPFTVETFGKPRRIVIDPDDHVLKNSKDVKLRSSILRGQAMVQQGDLAGALTEFKKALDVNQNSSLAHYRIAEVFFQQRNYQAAANAYRESLNGDGDPRWTEVWSHIQLGKIFDITGQRERATNEYRQALQTNDNTQGALDEARRYLQKAYEQPKGGTASGQD